MAKQRRSRQPLPPPPKSEKPSRRLLSQPAMLVALGLLTLTTLALAVLLALGVTGNTTQKLVVTSCQGGTPGCELRAATHQHANFALVIRGQQFDFGRPQFLSTDNDDKSAVTHLHQPRYTVVHVHRTATAWNEFLKSVGIELQDSTSALPGVKSDKACLTLPDGQKLCTSGLETLKFYVNGTKVDGIAFSGISDLDRVLVSFGSEQEEEVIQQIRLTGDDACIPSERCTDRIPKNEEPEPCTKSNDTCVKPGG